MCRIFQVVEYSIILLLHYRLCISRLAWLQSNQHWLRYFSFTLAEIFQRFDQFPVTFCLNLLPHISQRSALCQAKHFKDWGLSTDFEKCNASPTEIFLYFLHNDFYLKVFNKLWLQLLNEGHWRGIEQQNYKCEASQVFIRLIAVTSRPAF